MATYEEQRDKLTGKELVLAFDFPDFSTRFVTDRNAEGLATPGGWTVFDGITVEDEDGSSYDAKSGRVKVGGQSFLVPDKGEAVTAWLADNDLDGLANARVTLRSGFRHVAEAEWATRELVFEDYSVASRGGGGYSFELGNVLAAMDAGLYESIGGSEASINETSHPAGLDPGANEIVLEEEPEDWPAAGIAIISDDQAKTQELISYTGIARQGLAWKLEGVVRQVLGIGTGHTFPTEDVSIFPVWALRGGFGELAFRVLTTTDAAGDSTPEAQGTNPELENWLSDTNLENWAETTVGGSVNQETSDHIVGFSAVRFDRTGAGDININRSLDVTLEPGKWYVLTLLFKADQALTNGLEFRIRNVTQGLDLEDDGTGTTWSSGTYFHQFDADTDVRRATVVFQWDASFPGTDSTFISIRHGASTNPSSLWLDVGPGALVTGPFDSEPNGPYDAGDGNGLGLDVDYMGINYAEKILATYAPHPTFTSAGVMDTGLGALFVERDKIKDAKAWVEKLLRSFGLKPAVDELGRFTISKLYLVPPDNVTIGGEWRSEGFKASSWKRGWANAINSVSFGTDWNVSEKEYARPLPASVDQASITAFGKSAPIEVDCRGLRSGRLGFPDLQGRMIATKAATRILLELANPSSPLNLEPFLKYKDLSLLNTVTVLVPAIPDLTAGTRQAEARVFHVVSVAVDAKKGKVKLKVRERRVLNRPAIVGGNDLAGVTYDTATEEQRQFCAIAPDANGFSDGTTPYTVPP